MRPLPPVAIRLIDLETNTVHRALVWTLFKIAATHRSNEFPVGVVHQLGLRL
jgi:hypothetical protein